MLTSLERARDLRARRRSRCSATASARPTPPSPRWTTCPCPARAASARTRSPAPASPPPTSTSLEVYDSFTITAALSVEALGFCGAGEALDFVADGRIRPGGALPLNTTGGGLSYCHPGQYGVLLLVEAVRQLRGECGERQVPGAEIAVAHGTGGILSTHATVVLGVSPMSEHRHWTPGEVPPADENTAAWWDATREHRLTVQSCTACGARPAPAAGAVHRLRLDGAPRPGRRRRHRHRRHLHRRAPGPAPGARGAVRRRPGAPGRGAGRADPPRAGGARRGRLDASATRSTVAWVDLPDGRALPYFTPDTTTEEH